MNELDDGGQGDERSGDWGLLEPLARESETLTGDDAVLHALVDVERALLRAWGEEPVAPDGLGVAADALHSRELLRDELLTESRRSGVAVISLVDQLRRQAESAQAGSSVWVHRGATSQDILDSGLQVVAMRSLAAVRAALGETGTALTELAQAERSVLAIGRTLTQHAVPLTMGARVASWLDGVSSAIEALDGVEFPVQLGGPVGTGAEFDSEGVAPDAVGRLRARVAAELGLADPARSWQTERTPVLRVADAAALVVAVLGRIGRDLTLLATTELGEVIPTAGGGSSSMPHKHNPVDAVLLVSHGLRAPGLLATVHASALSVAERPAGEWHAEWPALRGLLRLAVGSSAAANSALNGLAVDRDAVARNLGEPPAAAAAILAAGSLAVDRAVARFTAVRKARS